MLLPRDGLALCVSCHPGSCVPAQLNFGELSFVPIVAGGSLSCVQLWPRQKSSNESSAREARTPLASWHVNEITVSESLGALPSALQSKEHILGLPVGQHIELSFTKDGEEVDRKYTPVR